MKKSKGCLNKKCTVNKNKVLIKNNSEFCTECGSKLEFVCVKCYRPISGKKNKCEYCDAKAKDTAGKVATGGGISVLIGTIIAAKLRKK